MMVGGQKVEGRLWRWAAWELCPVPIVGLGKWESRKSGGGGGISAVLNSRFGNVASGGPKEVVSR